MSELIVTTMKSSKWVWYDRSDHRNIRASRRHWHDTTRKRIAIVQDLTAVVATAQRSAGCHCRRDLHATTNFYQPAVLMYQALCPVYIWVTPVRAFAAMKFPYVETLFNVG